MALVAQVPAETNAAGAFVRQEYSIRERITADGSAGFLAEPGRYHLYVSLACPWAHRSIIVRGLLGLESVISMSVVDPIRDERGWAFRDGPGYSRDPITASSFCPRHIWPPIQPIAVATLCRASGIASLAAW